MTSGFPYKTVVDEVPASKRLTLKETVKTELGITVTTWDDLLDSHIAQASADFATFCCREFGAQKVTDSFRLEWNEGESITTLHLSNLPVKTIHAVYEDGIEIEAANYEIIAADGVLQRLDDNGDPTGWLPGVLITVQHTSGYTLLTELPNDVEAMCIQQVKATFLNRKTNPTLRSINLPDVIAKTFALPGGDNYGESGLLLGIEQKLRRAYRLPA